MAELTPDDKHKLGQNIGETIIGLFDIMAKLDDVTLQEAIDEWIAYYVAERIIEEATGEADATE